MEYIITDKQQFRQYQTEFRNMSRAKAATAQDHILYNLIRGKDLKRGFTPITNTNKLTSNYSNNVWHAFSAAKSDLTWALKKGYTIPCASSFTVDQRAQLLKALEEAKC